MSNKKMIMGIAAGVAALAVVGVICKRKGYFDGLGEKAGDFGHNLKDKFNSLKDSAKKKYEEATGHSADTQTAQSSKNATNTGNSGINPATA